MVRLEDGRVELDPDEQIRRVIALVFTTFAERGSGRKTLGYFKHHQILLPRRQTSGLLKGAVLWKEPTESIMIEILRNPAYTGAFVYGRRLTDPRRRKPGQRGTGLVRKPREDWMTIKPGTSPAYLTWEQSLQNPARLAENTQAVQAWQGSQQEKRGAPREGEALLQGLMYCSICGYRLRVAYKSASRYSCDGLKRHRAGPACMSVAGSSLEKVVIQACFEA